LIRVCGGSPRQFLKQVGPIDFEFDRSDHSVSPENPGEALDIKLEQKRPPRPILKMICPIFFSAGRDAGGEGRPVFLVGGVADHTEGIVRSFLSDNNGLKKQKKLSSRGPPGLMTPESPEKG